MFTHAVYVTRQYAEDCGLIMCKSFAEMDTCLKELMSDNTVECIEILYLQAYAKKVRKVCWVGEA